MGLPIIVSARSLTFYVGSQPYQISATQPNYRFVVEELGKSEPDLDRLIFLVTPISAVAAAVEAAEALPASAPDYLPAGRVSLTNNEVRYNGEPVEGVLVERLLDMLAQGFDIMPMVRFMENLYRNPAEHAREELYLWLEKAELPITDDGCFLAYKSVRSDFLSHHDAKTDNTPGRIVSMPRQDVDPVRDNVCSRGLHFCSKEYLRTAYGGSGTIVILKINPADVVSIPSDYDNTKGRAWQYEVLEAIDYDIQTHTWPAVVANNGAVIDPAALEHPSPLAGKLFSTYHDADLADRDARLSHASVFLGRKITSFTELTKIEAGLLIDTLEAVNEIYDYENDEARDDEITRIHELGIIDLRREASQAGLKGAWKGHTSKELREYLISRL